MQTLTHAVAVQVKVHAAADQVKVDWQASDRTPTLLIAGVVVVFDDDFDRDGDGVRERLFARFSMAGAAPPTAPASHSGLVRPV
ncbi:MAG: hypothetical protein QM778_38535 [Myxococcales bacterium]